MERETLVSQTGSSAGTAQLPLTMASCVLPEAFWAGINCLSLQQSEKGLLQVQEQSLEEEAARTREQKLCFTLGKCKGTGVMSRDP